MNKFRFTIQMLAIAIFTFAFASFAQAQATRTWVSGVGDDANPCSRTAPCKTFAGAISKTADPGEIDCVDPGGFGAVTITKSITIDGGGTFASILSSGVTGVNVNDSGSGAPNTKIVTLRNLSIQGAGTTLGTNGINFTSGKALHVEHCQIMNYSVSGITVAVNNAGGSELYVSDTSIYNVATGIRLTNANGASFASGALDNVNINHTSTNAVRLDAQGFAEIRDTNISFATTAGVSIAGANAQASIIDSMIAHCGTGISAAAGTSRIAHSSVVLNGVGVAFSGGGTLRTFGDNNFDGNPTPFSGGALTGIGGKL